MKQIGTNQKVTFCAQRPYIWLPIWFGQVVHNWCTSRLRGLRPTLLIENGKYYTFEHYGPLAAQKCSRGREWPGSLGLRCKNVLTFIMHEEKGRGFWAFWRYPCKPPNPWKSSDFSTYSAGVLAWRCYKFVNFKYCSTATILLLC